MAQRAGSPKHALARSRGAGCGLVDPHRYGTQDAEGEDLAAEITPPWFAEHRPGHQRGGKEEHLLQLEEALEYKGAFASTHKLVVQGSRGQLPHQPGNPPGEGRKPHRRFGHRDREGNRQQP